MSEELNREEAVNAHVALLISKPGVTADVETIHVHGKHRLPCCFSFVVCTSSLNATLMMWRM